MHYNQKATPSETTEPTTSGASELGDSGATEPSKSAAMEHGLYADDVRDKWIRETPAGYLRLCKLRALLRAGQQSRGEDTIEHQVGQLPSSVFEHRGSATMQREICTASHMTRPCEPNITPDAKRQPGEGTRQIRATLPTETKRKLNACTQATQKVMQGGKKNAEGPPWSLLRLAAT